MQTLVRFLGLQYLLFRPDSKTNLPTVSTGVKNILLGKYNQTYNIFLLQYVSSAHIKAGEMVVWDWVLCGLIARPSLRDQSY